MLSFSRSGTQLFIGIIMVLFSVLSTTYFLSGSCWDSLPLAIEPTVVVERNQITAATTRRKFKSNNTFEPGSLLMNRSEAISHCWTGSRKRDTIMSDKYYFLYSEHYNVSVVLIEKAGTSTQKKVLIDGLKQFEFLTLPTRSRITRPLFHVTTTREPFSRFVSAYKEVMLRFGLGELSRYIPFDIPNRYSRFLNHLEGKNKTEEIQIWKAQTPEHLKLKTDMFETFVEDFDGEDMLDIHFALQVPKLWDPVGKKSMQRFDMVMDADNLTNDLARLLRTIKAPPLPKHFHNVRARNRDSNHLDIENLSNKTIQKICRVAALDFCCLNYELPEACQKENIPPGDRVMCEWVPPGEGKKNDTHQIRHVFV